MKKWEQFSFLFGIREEKFLNIFLDLFLPVKIAWLIEVSQTMDTDSLGFVYKAFYAVPPDFYKMKCMTGLLTRN